jgi:hypothetical protein
VAGATATQPLLETFKVKVLTPSLLQLTVCGPCPVSKPCSQLSQFQVNTEGGAPKLPLKLKEEVTPTQTGPEALKLLAGVG